MTNNYDSKSTKSFLYYIANFPLHLSNILSNMLS